MAAEPTTGPAEDRARPSETVGGFLAAISIFASLIGIAWHPLRLIPLAVLLALLAAGMSARTNRLPLWAILIAAFSFLAGMSIAVVTKNPLW